MFNFGFLLVFISPLLSFVISFDAFKDNAVFDISWAGPVSLREGQVTEDGKDFLSSRESVFITTKDQEKYRCILPIKEKDSESLYSQYGGPEPQELLETLIKDGRCSYRLEAYWSYELCHGSHVRQFHEERTAKGTKLQEFVLGQMKPKQGTDKKKEPEPAPIPSPPQENAKPNKVLTRKMDGRDTPYYDMVMGNGTPCDLLNNRPRVTHVLYICHPQSHNEILSVKEVTTCEYEVEVLTPLLCANDAYRYKEESVNAISCHSVDKSPDEPRSYSELMEEQEMERMAQKETMIFDKGVQNEPADPQPEPTQTEERQNIPAQPDRALTRDFLNGDYCLRGGSGWWKYELCYGKQVIQYHIEDHGGRTDVLLGKWNKEAHIIWAMKRKAKPSGYAVHYYSDGDVCDLTGKPRHVQVRLKCKESSHLQELSIYLMEPETCEYILGVESPIICSLLKNMDEHGLFPIGGV